VRRVFALLLLFAAAGVACADTLQGDVIVVIDGDTVLFKPDHFHPSSRAFLKVRLAGIDAPEADQPHGDEATRALRQMALKRRATLEVVATDVYRRKLGRLVVGGLEINTELVRGGHAWIALRDADAPLRSLQEDARRVRRGLWLDADPMPPWVWRRTRSASVKRISCQRRAGCRPAA
jgi:endonuclease YncB( thermonuclease family)